MANGQIGVAVVAALCFSCASASADDGFAMAFDYHTMNAMNLNSYLNEAFDSSTEDDVTIPGSVYDPGDASVIYLDENDGMSIQPYPGLAQQQDAPGTALAPTGGVGACGFPVPDEYLRAGQEILASFGRCDDYRGPRS